MKKILVTFFFLAVIQIVIGQVSNFGLPCEGTPTVSDHQGNVYQTVQLGTQCWMAENMRCTSSPSGKSWVRNPVFSVDNPVFKSYYFTPRNTQNGILYNWSAAMDLNINEYAYFASNERRRGICPKGWHLPNSMEWTQLLDSLGGTKKAGAVMKSPTSQWIEPVMSEELCGFSAVPAGIYTEEGLRNTGRYAHFWSSSTFDRQNAWSCGLFSYNSDCYNMIDYKCYGHSVRCLRD